MSTPAAASPIERTPLPKRWEWPPEPDRAALTELVKACDHPILAQILYRRGIRTAEEARRFLDGDELYDNPFHLPGMSAAVLRIKEAIRRGQQIAVYGDFDVDGVTATALLTATLRSLGAKVKPYIPHRVDEGYGVNRGALKKLRQSGCDLVVTVDCGVRSVAEVQYARRLGLDIIVTDHHNIGPELPPAHAIINPKIEGSRFPFRELAGVGVAFRLAQALLRAARHDHGLPDPSLDEESLLDLVALGTVADVTPLLGENRVLVRRGLEALNRAQRPGIRQLLRAASVEPGQATAWSIGFLLAPRLNAAGRLDTAVRAYKLLTADDDAVAAALADELDQLNRKRQEMTKAQLVEAIQQIDEADFLHLVSGPDYDHGIVGLVAARLVEATYRPSIVVREEGEICRGSARSIPELNITAALDQCRDLLIRHGGHAAAAGFTARTEMLPALRERLQAIAREQLRGIDLAPKLQIDALVRLRDLNRALYDALQRLEPCGHDNEAPVLAVRAAEVVQARPVGGDGSHLRLTVRQDGCVYDAIAFNFGASAAELPERIDLAFTFEINRWNGREAFQLNVKDLRPTEG